MVHEFPLDTKAHTLINRFKKSQERVWDRLSVGTGPGDGC